ncbi:FecCD family ABC transporter permease [Protaetiibacter mangrovi]|uniref:Iron ABC transporter permease n=1 Tax=Protaetiibacter mangrovi TaxID=2970926 RepID=A0ABT1ZEL3_9MICO|nr:iron ABC transporter permease [Protaetiibacter mangrovi]MCS0499139.1 iron ABC transporter permease [Protaetiibacter mangrovi]TPX02085.1 iron ABC transporter permease [Schumannella luteola]
MTPSAPATTAPGAASLRRPAGVRLAWLLAGVVALLLATVASLAFGTRPVTIEEVLAALAGDTSSIGTAAVASRVPRTLLALLVGAALALSGTALQAVTRNPLADPGILGLSTGASLAVVTGIAFFGLSDPVATVVVAVLGSAAAGVFVYAIGSLGPGGASPLKLALAGAATTAALGSLVSAVLLPRVEVMTTFRFWQIGGVGGATWDRILLVAPALALGALVVLATARGMNSLALGDDVAAGLGERVARTRLVAAAGAFVLCGAATAIAGPIGFVGLVVPHLCRLLVGTDHRWLLPATAIVGAGLLVAADVVGRLVARPEEVEVGIITALIGAPVFIALARRRKVREL